MIQDDDINLPRPHPRLEIRPMVRDGGILDLHADGGATHSTAIPHPASHTTGGEAHHALVTLELALVPLMCKLSEGQ